VSDKVSAHWLRHRSQTIERGVNPVLVKDTLDHSNLAITNIFSQMGAEQAIAQVLSCEALNFLSLTTFDYLARAIFL